MDPADDIALAQENGFRSLHGQSGRQWRRFIRAGLVEEEVPEAPEEEQS